MAIALDNPYHKRVYFVRFLWGADPDTTDNPYEVLINDSHEDISGLMFGNDPTAGFRDVNDMLGGTWQACPELEIDLPLMDGSLDPRPCRLRLPYDTAIAETGGWGTDFFDKLTWGGPFGEVEVQVFERVTSDTSSEERVYGRFRGIVSKTTRLVDGKHYLAEIEVAPVQALLGVPLGLRATPQCNWVFGDFNCRKFHSALEQNVTISAVTMHQVSVSTSVTYPAGAANYRYFEHGFLEFENLRIGIRNWWYLSPQTFHMRNRVPAWWVGQSVRLVPGCDKTIETCRDRYSNEQYFGGFGIAIPAYLPNYENPTL